MNTFDASTSSPFGKPLLGAIAVTLSALTGAVAVMAADWPAALVVSAAIGIAAYLVLAKRGSKRTPLPMAGATPKERPSETAMPIPAQAVIPADRVDSLTGLANMNGLNAWFAEKGPRLAADGKGIVVIVARLDDFQPLIGSRGQSVADAVLVEVAKRVVMVAGDEGIAARTDGEEFASVVTVVPDRSEAIAKERAGDLIEMISRPVEHPMGAVWIGGSVGAAVGSPLDGEGTLARARVALASAVHLGRGQFVVDTERE